MPKKIVIFVLLLSLVLLVEQGYGLNLESLKVYFLKGDYKQAIIEGEKILAGTDYHARDLDELYYILGLSYLKDGNLLRASDIFEIILKEFKDSAYKERALLGLGDTYFLQGNYNEAQRHYQDLLNNNSSLRPTLYYRLSLCAVKLGQTQVAKEYLAKLKKDFLLSLETRINPELLGPGDIYYSVQVGCFSKPTNAQNLTQKLMQKGYPAYIEEINTEGKINYRVRVGKFSSRLQAQELEKKLCQEGYPTKIYP
jgi:tetratricopeptide (TPR) repeat protein